jgi:hypothetical protein
VELRLGTHGSLRDRAARDWHHHEERIALCGALSGSVDGGLKTKFPADARTRLHSTDDGHRWYIVIVVLVLFWVISA